MRRKASLYIKDILEAIARIEEFTEGMTFEDFAKDDKTSSAVIRKLGEFPGPVSLRKVRENWP